MHLGLGLGMTSGRGVKWAPFSGAVVDMDFKQGQYYGTTPVALTASTGSLKITGSGLQVITGDLITTTDATLLAALNAATTVIRIKANVPSITTANANGIFFAKVGAISALTFRLRGSTNQSGLAAGHAPDAGGLILASTAAGIASDGVSFVGASRHRTNSASLTGNGGAIVNSAPTGKATSISVAQFGISEGGVVLNGYIERLTVWTDDPSDAVLLTRSI